MLADGTVHECADGDDLLAARVSIGALGVVTAVTLQAVPAFTLHGVDAPAPLEETLDRIDELAAANDHFELFTFPHSPLALTRTNNRTDGAAAAPRPAARVGRRHPASTTTRFGAGQPARPRAPGVIPALNRIASRLAGIDAAASTAPTASSRRRGACASRRWSTRSRARTSPRPCGRCGR